MLGNSFGYSPFTPSSRVLISLSKNRFVTLTCPLACGWLEMSSGCGCLIPGRIAWTSGCQTAFHYQRQVLVVSQIDILPPSKQNFGCSSPLSSPVVLPLPIWWSNRLRPLRTLANVFRQGMVPWCRAPIARTAKVLSLVLVLLASSRASWQIVDIYHTGRWMHWCLLVWTTNSSLL